MVDTGQVLLVTVVSVGSIVILGAIVMMCSWCFGKKDVDEDDDEGNVDILAQKYKPVPVQMEKDVRQLNKRSWEPQGHLGPGQEDSPVITKKTINSPSEGSVSSKPEDGAMSPQNPQPEQQTLIEFVLRFERPGRSQVVTEHVQPLPNTHTALNDSLGVSRQSSTQSYQSMGPHRPLGHTDSLRSQSADDENNSVWKGVRNMLANRLMDDEDTTPVIDPTEGVDCKLGRIQVALSYDFQSLTLTLKVFQGTGLPAKDFTGTSDPYVKILLLPDKKHKLVTKVKKRNLNPRWNECFLFEGWPHNKLLEKTLYLQVIDYDRFSRDDPIGETYIPLNEVDLSQSPMMWRFLQPCKDSRGKLGELLLSLCYQPAVGRLTVIVLKAKDLKAKDITGASEKGSKDICGVMMATLGDDTPALSRVQKWAAEVKIDDQSLEILNYRYFQGSFVTSPHTELHKTELSYMAFFHGHELYPPHLDMGERTTIFVSFRESNFDNYIEDPYVKLWLMYGGTKVEKKKTSIKMRTLNPIYNESFIYEIPWEKIREAQIEVTVMDFDKVGRNEMIGKIMLGSRSGPLETRHWNDMITKPRQQVAQWHLLKD